MDRNVKQSRSISASGSELAPDGRELSRVKSEMVDNESDAEMGKEDVTSEVASEHDASTSMNLSSLDIEETKGATNKL